MSEYEIVLKIDGSIQDSNFDQVKSELLSRLSEVNLNPQTDEEFHEAVQIMDMCKAGEKAIAKAKQQATEEVADIKALFEAMDEVSEKLRSTRLDLSKKIAAEKENRKKDIIRQGEEAVKSFAAELVEKDLFLHGVIKVDLAPIFQATIRKHKIKTMQAAVDNAVADQVTAMQNLAMKARRNYAEYSKLPQDESMLFRGDINDLLPLEAADFDHAIKSRIQEYREKKDKEEKRKAEEEKRIEAAKAAKEAEEARAAKEAESNVPDNGPHGRLFDPGTQVGTGPDPAEYSREVEFSGPTREAAPDEPPPDYMLNTTEREDDDVEPAQESVNHGETQDPQVIGAVIEITVKGTREEIKAMAKKVHGIIAGEAIVSAINVKRRQ